MKETLCLPMMKVAGSILHAVRISFSESVHKPMTDETDHLIHDTWSQTLFTLWDNKSHAHTLKTVKSVKQTGKCCECRHILSVMFISSLNWIFLFQVWIIKAKFLQNQATEHVVLLVTTCPSSWYLATVGSIKWLEHNYETQKSKSFIQNV